jgi:ketosteroid isomerase-like protein
MSQENVDRARRAYTAMNDGYRTRDFRRVITEFFDPEIVLKPAGILPAGPGEVRGHDDLVAFNERQMEGFADLSMTPERIIDGGDHVIVPFTLGGRASFSGLPVEFSFVHVGTYRDGEIARLDVYANLDDALEAAGLEE